MYMVTTVFFSHSISYSAVQFGVFHLPITYPKL